MCRGSLDGEEACLPFTLPAKSLPGLVLLLEAERLAVEPTCNLWGFPGGAARETQAQHLGQGMPWSRHWQPTAVFLPGKSHGQRVLADCSPCGHEEPAHT